MLLILYLVDYVYSSYYVYCVLCCVFISLRLSCIYLILNKETHNTHNKHNKLDKLKKELNTQNKLHKLNKLNKHNKQTKQNKLNNRHKPNKT